MSGATSYNVYQSATSGGEGTTAYKTGLTSPAFTDTGLSNGVAYFYTVTAVNAAGESTQSTEAGATPQPPPPPAAPATLTATAGSGQVSLSWPAVTGAASYTLSYGTAPGAYTATVTGLPGLTDTVTGLTNGTPYYFAVQAVNAGGTGPLQPRGHGDAQRRRRRAGHGSQLRGHGGGNVRRRHRLHRAARAPAAHTPPSARPASRTRPPRRSTRRPATAARR